MDIENIIKSTNYVEFINKLDNLANELLYSKNSGYINLSSKDAIESAQKIIEKFSYETDKIVRESQQENIDCIVKTKKEEFISEVKNHYNKEALNWSYSVFEQIINNSILKISIHAKDKEYTDKILNNILSALTWISTIYDFSSEKKQNILDEIYSRLNEALSTGDSDYISKSSPDRSKGETYLKIRELITIDDNEFINLDLNNFRFELSDKDMSYFIKIKNMLKGNKNNILDEINLVDYFLNALDIKNSDEKYDLITQIQEDLSHGNDISENEKVNIIKRRIEIFQNKDRYYKKLLGF